MRVPSLRRWYEPLVVEPESLLWRSSGGLKRCHRLCLREQRRAAEQKSGIQVVRAFLGFVGDGFVVTLWAASRLSWGEMLKCRVSAEGSGRVVTWLARLLNRGVCSFVSLL